MFALKYIWIKKTQNLFKLQIFLFFCHVYLYLICDTNSTLTDTYNQAFILHSKYLTLRFPDITIDLSKFLTFWQNFSNSWHFWQSGNPVNFWAISVQSWACESDLFNKNI